MGPRVLITGGAGFIGSHLADELLARGYRVRLLDALVAQVHGPERTPPGWLDPRAELVVGDVRDREAVRAALEGVDAVFHLAAAVGVGQSMYQIAEYTGVNNLGTAVLLEGMIEARTPRLVVASSMSIYGEGRYRSATGAVFDDTRRSLEQLRKGQWEQGQNGTSLSPVFTPEDKAPMLSSVYALSKYDQERLCLLVGAAYGIRTVALRFFNVYGPRQSLGNPYTGVLAIFAARLLNDRAPSVYEDGEQQRDFVSVHDVSAGCRLALECEAASGEVINIGSGTPRTVRSVAENLAAVLGKPHIAPELTRRYRVGDVRHCFADIRKARALLGYEPRVAFEDGLGELSRWLRAQCAVDNTESARRELEVRGLSI